MTKRMIAACLALAGCASGAGEKKELTYLCAGGRLAAVSFSGDGAQLRLGEDSFALQRVPSASGVRYNGVRASLFTKDDEALVEVDGRQFGPCQEVKKG